MTYTIVITASCQQLYDAIESKLCRLGVAKADLDGVWEEVAGHHAMGEKYPYARKQRNTDENDYAEYAFTFHTVRFRYADDVNERQIIINKILYR